MGIDATFACSRPLLRIEIITTAMMYATQYGGWPYVGPAFRYALDEIRDTYPCLNISHALLYDYRYQTCPDWASENANMVGSYVLDKRRQAPDVTVFILPGCSAEVLSMLPLINEMDMPLITSVAVSPDTLVKAMYPFWISTSTNSPGYLRIYCSFIKIFKWKTFGILVNAAGNSGYLAFFDMVQAEIKRHPGTQMHKVQIDTRKEAPGYYEHILRQLNYVSRVFLIIGFPSRSFRKFMIAAQTLNMTSGEHVYIVMVAFRTGLNEISWKLNDSDDEVARLAFRSVFLIELHRLNYGEVNGTYAQQFATTMKGLSKLQYNYSYPPGELVSPHVVSTYAALIIFAQVMNQLYETSTWRSNVGGRLLAKHFLNRTFETAITSVTINEFGERTPIWVINQFDSVNGTIQTVMQFEPNNPDINFVTPIQWPSKWPPPDEPYCGFRGDRPYCVEQINPATIAVPVTITGCLAILTIVTWFLLWRKANMKKTGNVWWRLDTQRLVIMQNNSSESKGVSSERVGVYDEETVWITPLCVGITHSRDPSESAHRSSHVHQLFHQLRRLNHANINRFFGICLTKERNLVFVCAYCSRGSLADLLNNLRLDKDLELSLIQDLLQGLAAVHQSSLKYHGALSSRKCLIDKRFTLKLGSLTYPRLRSLMVKGLDLANSTGVSDTSPPNKQSLLPPSDISSAALIMGQILLGTESGPNDLSQIATNTTPQHTLMPLIADCLNKTPDARPDISSVIKVFKNATGQKSNKNLVERIVRRLEQYTKELDSVVAARTVALNEERRKCDFLLLEMFPANVVDQLRKCLLIHPEAFESVTIMFSDLWAFSEFVKSRSPYDIMAFLNDVYSVFDSVLPSFDAYKVETIKDSYMVVSGLPKRNGSAHAKEICLLAKALILAYSKFTVSRTALRVGMHSGPCVASVVGKRTPRYCLFGDTVNTASRMLLYSENSHIHLSFTTAQLLQNAPEFVLVERGNIAVKGKEDIRTFWLNHE